MSTQRQSQGPTQKKQLLVLSEKNIQNGINASAGRVEAPRVPALERSEDNIIVGRNQYVGAGDSFNQSQSTSAPLAPVATSAAALSQKQKLEKVKSIYNQYNIHKVSQAEFNNYADLGIKGLKTRLN